MLKELIIPAKELPCVKNFTGGKDSLGSALTESSWNSSDIPKAVIIGITDNRASGFPSLAESADCVREQLYSLSHFSKNFPVVDLGNIKTGKEVKDTYAALKIVSEEITSLGIPLLVLGGSQYFTLPLLSGFNKSEPVLTVIDDRLDSLLNENGATDDLFLVDIPTGATVNLMAAQSFFVPEDSKDSFSEDFNGSMIMLGELRKDIREMEPFLRETDLVSFDFGSLRMCEAPGQLRNSPNGLSGEEACQLAWYSGMATIPGCFSLFGYAPEKDPERIGAMMAAQIAWYYLNGVSKKIDETPQDEAIDFAHYIITVEGIPDPVTFLKHPVSNRWWMEVPSEDCEFFPKRVPCSKKDYLKAGKNEIPERWWSYFNKMY